MLEYFRIRPHYHGLPAMSCLLDRLKVKRLKGSLNSKKCTNRSLSSSLQEIHFIRNKHIQIEHNRIKHPNWQEATNWLFISVNARHPRTNPAPKQDSNLGMSDCESDALTTWPCCLPTVKRAEWLRPGYWIATLGSSFKSCSGHYYWPHGLKLILPCLADC